MTIVAILIAFALCHFVRELGRFRDARWLSKRGLTWTSGVAVLVEGALLAQKGDEEAADTALREGVDLLDRAEMRLFAASARDRLGRLRGGDEGAALLSASHEVMAEEGVRERDAMNAMLMAGFPL